MSSWLEFIGGLVVAAIGAGAIWLTQREGSKTSAASIEQRERETVMDAWRELIDPLRDELERVRTSAQADVQRLTAKVDELNDKVDQLQTWRHRAAEYIRQLVRSLRDNGLEPPTAPAGLDLD